jgi:hypothetical protein
MRRAWHCGAYLAAKANDHDTVVKIVETVLVRAHLFIPSQSFILHKYLSMYLVSLTHWILNLFFHGATYKNC